jgi:hypothetical protein
MKIIIATILLIFGISNVYAEEGLLKSLTPDGADFHTLFLCVESVYTLEKHKVIVIDGSETVVSNPKFLIVIDLKSQQPFKVNFNFTEVKKLNYNAENKMLECVFEVEVPKIDDSNIITYSTAEVKKSILLP